MNFLNHSYHYSVSSFPVFWNTFIRKKVYITKIFRIIFSSKFSINVLKIILYLNMFEMRVALFIIKNCNSAETVLSRKKTKKTVNLYQKIEVYKNKLKI